MIELKLALNFKISQSIWFEVTMTNFMSSLCFTVSHTIFELYTFPIIRCILLKKENISNKYKKLRKYISESIYEQWALEKISGDSELARQAGFNPERWVYK